MALDWPYRFATNVLQDYKARRLHEMMMPLRPPELPQLQIHLLLKTITAASKPGKRRQEKTLRLR